MNTRPTVDRERTFRKTVSLELSQELVKSALQAYLIRNFAEFRGTKITISFFNGNAECDPLTIIAKGIWESRKE